MEVLWWDWDCHGVAVVAALQPCAFMGSIDGVSEQGHQGLVMVKWSRAEVLATSLLIPHIHFLFLIISRRVYSICL